MTREEDLFERLASALPSEHPYPARPEAVARVEAEAGHALPPLMRRIYIELADGGWGPDYGVLGVDDGHTDDLGGRVSDVYGTWHTTEGLGPDDITLPPSDGELDAQVWPSDDEDATSSTLG